MLRFIESKAYSSFRDRGAMRWREFATPLPASTPLDSARNLLDVSAGMLLKQDTFTDNASVNLVPLPGGRELLALSESRPSAYRVDAKVFIVVVVVVRVTYIVVLVIHPLRNNNMHRRVL